MLETANGNISRGFRYIAKEAKVKNDRKIYNFLQTVNVVKVIDGVGTVINLSEATKWINKKMVI